MSREHLLALASILALDISLATAQTPASLPVPSGKHPVGRTSFHWVDTKRPELATDDKADHRELLAQVWYPARAAGAIAGPYLPGVERLVASPAGAALARLFGPSWKSIAANDLSSHAFDQARVASARWPILLFSPGGGVPVAAYTVQLEDLASHGYLVIGVDPPYEVDGIVFPGGRVVTAANAYWDRMRRESANGEEFEKSLTDLRAADLRFVRDKLEDLQRERTSVFRGKLDLSRVGAFGHSRGGRTAARLCQADHRIKACLNQDGNTFWHPFWLDHNGNSMKQPFMMLDHLDPDLPDEAFAQMRTTREAYVQRRSARQAEAREKIYTTIAGGSYHVKIKTPGVSHNSFTDIRLLGRPDGAGINSWPANVRAVTPHAQILATINAWTRAFFEKTIRGNPASLDQLTRVRSSEVETLQFAPRHQ